MAYCGPKGIPLSAFLGWSEADQDAALSWQGYESRRCGECGTHPDDWHPDHGGDRNAYHSEHYTCPGCVALQRHREHPDIADGKTRGLHLRLAPGTHGDCPRCHLT